MAPAAPISTGTGTIRLDSWRKTVATKLDRACVSHTDTAAVLGHSRSFSFDVYSGGARLAAIARCDRARDVLMRARVIMHRCNFPR
jgi:hypothetical protein